MTTPFSLLIPVYAGDQAEFLRIAFESSVQQQTLMPAQVVLVQDGPISVELQAEIKRLVKDSPVTVTQVVIEENRGLANALNVGIAACDYELVARMDADDYSVPERFERQLPLLGHGYDLVGSAMFEFESRPEKRTASRVLPERQVEIAKHAKLHNPMNHPTMVFRKSVVESVGGYEPLGSMEDYWLVVRMLNAGCSLRNSTEQLVGYRVSSGVFKRRGGWDQFRTELQLQREMRNLRMLTRFEYARNVCIKGTYRLIPAGFRRSLSRAFFRSQSAGS